MTATFVSTGLNTLHEASLLNSESDTKSNTTESSKMAAHLGADFRTSKSMAESVRTALQSAVDYSLVRIRPDGHWCGELKSNVTITAEYVFLRQAIGLDMCIDRDALCQYLLSQQNADGSWGIAPHYPGDVSTSTEAYLALRILGHPTDSLEMKRACDFVTSVGGVAKVRIFTRIYLATFGLFPWTAIPQLPAELILMPTMAPINIYRLASWARSTVIPLLIVCHHKPNFALPNGVSTSNDFLDELWCNALEKQVPYSDSLFKLLSRGDVVGFTFTAIDSALGKVNGLRNLWPLRSYALRKCVQWILSHQEPSGDWAGIFPPMHVGILALVLEGFTIDDSPVRRGLEAVERFSWKDQNGKRMQACVSPVWDTILMSIACTDAKAALVEVGRALTWVQSHQLLGSEGDWRVYRPNTLPGGFSFEYFNAWYPDVDDTAAAVIAFLKHDPESVTSCHVLDAVKWILAMQNRDGGWAAFDAENDKLFLNRIPFSDMESLCDPSTADIVGRVLEAFGLVLVIAHKSYVTSSPAISSLLPKLRDACTRGINYLSRTQEVDGSWFGRWGVNYIYGTSNALCGLGYFCIEGEESLAWRLARPAREFLLFIQNSDGGWGELPTSYRSKPSTAMQTPSNTEEKCTPAAPSTSSQTAWALMALLPFLSCSHAAIEAGVEYLVRTQTNDDDTMSSLTSANADCAPPSTAVVKRGLSWDGVDFTGTGFPNHFYLGYDFYRHYFPMMALGRYLERQSLEEKIGKPSYTLLEEFVGL